MRKNIAGVIVGMIVVLGLSACSKDEAASRVEAPRAVAPAGAMRNLDATQRGALAKKLDTGGVAHAVWFATAQNDREAANFQTQLQHVFQEAGWKVQGNAPVTFPLKAGVFFFMADEEPPDHVRSIEEAFYDAGIDIKAGRGYRRFFEDKKKEDPGWQGIQLAPDQDFVLVIGRNPG